MQKSLSIKLEHHQKAFLGSFSRKINKEKNSYFRQKSWVNPFRKIQKWRLLKINMSIVNKAFLFKNAFLGYKNKKFKKSKN